MVVSQLQQRQFHGSHAVDPVAIATINATKRGTPTPDLHRSMIASAA
jgi:hypothetical protein